MINSCIKYLDIYYSYNKKLSNIQWYFCNQLTFRAIDVLIIIYWIPVCKSLILKFKEIIITNNYFLIKQIILNLKLLRGIQFIHRKQILRGEGQWTLLFMTYTEILAQLFIIKMMKIFLIRVIWFLISFFLFAWTLKVDSGGFTHACRTFHVLFLSLSFAISIRAYICLSRLVIRRVRERQTFS